MGLLLWPDSWYCQHWRWVRQLDSPLTKRSSSGIYPDNRQNEWQAPEIVLTGLILELIYYAVRLPHFIKNVLRLCANVDDILLFKKHKFHQK